MKRQRVGVACAKCRELKAKCDGRQPICGRCEGYGFRCTWATGSTRGRASRAGPSGTDDLSAANQQRDTTASYEPSASTSLLPIYSMAIQDYETLIGKIREHLDGTNQAFLDRSLGTIRQRVSQDQEGEEFTTPRSEAIPRDGTTAMPSCTYVGKASDIHFINSVHQSVRDPETPVSDVTFASNYIEPHALENSAFLNQPILFPSQKDTDQFLRVYLSTIHIAYPFISQSSLLEALLRFHSREIHQPEFRPWLAIFNFIFAIGSYYTSFPHGKASSTQHHNRYYEQGLYFSQGLKADCSLENIWVLLVQCFFLLAVCRTDQCWNTVGFAIRMGQSIGLHVEHSLGRDPDRADWRRTWYSLYVLDRLLALQLGRPMAIQEADFCVEMPSPDDEAPWGSPSDRMNPLAGIHSEHGGMMEYFLEVIRFSQLVSLVILGLYQPSQIDLPPVVMLNTASDLDKRLDKWKSGLPRKLRFDLGHTFAKSIPFKRQRNMLAVKFHHLRALIYRPFLCLSLLQRENHLFMNLLVQDKEQIFKAELSCIHEAQQTARLLHGLVDEQSLVHDFPWWQMISCLICASSILFVAESFFDNANPFGDGILAQNLREDAETCLKVFEALSVNSTAAQKAAKILEGLSKIRRSNEGSLNPSASLPSASCMPSHENAYSNPQRTVALPPSPFRSSQIPVDTSSLCDWPSEISDAMGWSLQFLDYPDYEQFFNHSLR